jgi:hypothetical protein
LGFVVGLWMVFCALLFMNTWRVAYFGLLDELYNKIYVFVAVKWASMTMSAAAEWEQNILKEILSRTQPIQWKLLMDQSGRYIKVL